MYGEWERKQLHKKPSSVVCTFEEAKGKLLKRLSAAKPDSDEASEFSVSSPLVDEEEIVH